MLGMLFRYQMKATAKLGAIILVIIALSGVLAFILMSFADRYYSDYSLSVLNTVGEATQLALFMAGAFFTFVPYAATFALFVFIVQRFYKNLYTDEGYLTLTLPVKTSAILASHVLVAILWLTIAVAMTVISSSCVMQVVLGDSFWSSDGGVSALEFLGLFFSILGGNFDYSFGSLSPNIILGVSNCLVTIVLQIALAFLAFSLSARFFIRHKVAAGVGFYVLLSWGISLTLGVVSTIVIYSLSDYVVSTIVLTSTTVAGVVVNAILAAVAFLVSHYLLDKRIDLA